MSIVYPPVLPAPLSSGYGMGIGQTDVRTEMDAGPARQRRRHQQKPVQLALSWLMTRDQLSVFEYFYEVVLDGGAEWFDAPLSSGVGCSVSVPLRMISGYEVTQAAADGLWQITANAELRALPEPRAEYLLLDGASGTFASTPDSAANSVTGNLHIFARVAADDWTPATLRTIAAKRNGGAGNTSYALRLDLSGKLTLYWVSPSAPTTFIVRSSTIAVPVVDGAYADVEATLDVDNGASGHDVKFFVNGDQLGDTITTAGVTSIIDRDLALQIGAIDNGASELWKGKIARVAIRNGINGPLAAVFDASDGKHQAATFVSSETGETWTLNGNAQLVKPSLVGV
jgi:hypothetical protein